MTVYNGMPYVTEAVQSILNQTYRDFEFLIVDNASVDNTVSEIERFRDTRINLLQQPENQGQTRALNRAIREASGRFLARMDADDVSLPERLALQQTHMKAHPEAAVVGTWIEEIDRNGFHVKTMTYPTDPLTIRCNLLSDGDLTHRCVAHPSAMLRKEAILQVGGYNESIRIAQDYDLWTRLISQWQIHNIEKILLKYRVFPESTSKSNLPEMSLELDRTVFENIRRLAPGLSNEERCRLVRMLRNQSPLPQETPGRLYALFDRFFDEASRPWGNSSQLPVLRDRIKTYYSPRLFRHHPAAVLAWVLQMTIRQPTLWTDSKWFKNIAKSAFIVK